MFNQEHTEENDFESEKHRNVLLEITYFLISPWTLLCDIMAYQTAVIIINISPLPLDDLKVSASLVEISVLCKAIVIMPYNYMLVNVKV